MKNPIAIPSHQLRYAYWTDAIDPDTKLPSPGLGAHWFHIFDQPVRLRSVEWTRAQDQVGGRPERLTIEAYTTQEPRGTIQFDDVVHWRNDCCRLSLPDVPVLAVSQRCHWKQPVPVTPYQIHPRPWSVPFDIFEPTTWRGIIDNRSRLNFPEPPVHPALRVSRVRPRGTKGLKAWNDDLFVHFESRFLKVAFSLKRPRIAHLAWDGLGTGRVRKNFLVATKPSLASGPFTRDLAFPAHPQYWGGRVEVDGNCVIYHDLVGPSGLSVDAEFEVHARGITWRLRQHCAKRQTFLEAETWRMVWDGRQVYSLATLAQPVRGNHRNGRVESRGGFHASGQGTLTFEATNPIGVQVECGGWYGRWASAGFQLGCVAEPHGPVTLTPGTHETEIEMRVANVEPETRKKIHPGLRRAWGSAFAFRPEFGGMSNNSFSLNCHHCQYIPAEVARFTRNPAPLPPMVDLVRYTVELALQGGPGAAAQFTPLYDAAPSLVNAAADCHRPRPDKWLADIWPHFEPAIQFILDHLDADGMYTNHHRSGNSGTCVAGNAWDAVAFGHHDGYSGALAYRALRNAAPLVPPALARRCERAADRLRVAYVRTLFNPETGWLAGWRSADGKLHDYGFPMITAMAATFGILEAKSARSMLSKLEKKRIELGFTDFRFGVVPNLFPISRADSRNEHYDRPFAYGGMHVPLRQDGADTHGNFTNGGLTPAFAVFYLRAMSQFGFKKTADQICDQMLESLDRGQFDGCENGAECFTPDGMASGYEGTLSHCFHVVLAIAEHRGWIRPASA